ncbi:MAG: hypothetical protein ABR576_07605 [Thermoanaerobaculia bacterium]
MLSRVARAIEQLFGSTAVTAASVLQTVATLLWIAAVALCLLRGALSLRAWRYGWERGLVVRCRRCGRLAADPAQPVCPNGHPVRFPAAAARMEEIRRRLARWSRAARAYPILLSVFLAVLATAGYLQLRVGRLRSPLAGMAASLAFLFFLALLYAAGRAVAAGFDGWVSRLVHANLALLLLLPVLFLGSLSRSFEPVERRVLGHLWSTPTALYVSTGKRARRVGPAADHLQAFHVEARAPAAGVVWQGLTRLHAAGVDVPWKGAGGRTARWLERFARDPGATGPLVRGSQGVPVPANVRILIVRERDELKFLPEP